MGVESVRQANIESGLETPGSAESEEIQIELDPVEIPPIFDNLEDYPFSEQDIVRGRYHYESSPRFGQSETGKGKFQIRTGSGLIILQTQDDRPRPKKIFSALNQAIDGDAEIKENFVPNQNQVWNFIEHGDIQELNVITPNGQIKSANQVSVDWEEMSSQYPIEIALLSFYLDGEEIRVRYHDDSLEINSDISSEREYVIQIFESVMSK